MKRGLCGLLIAIVLAVGWWDASAQDLTTLLSKFLVNLRAGNLYVDSSNLDVLFVRDAADKIAQRRGTNAQTFNLYRTYTSTSDYQRVQLSTSADTTYGAGGAAWLVTQTATASAMGLTFGTNNSIDWGISTAHHFFPGSANTQDIGDSTNTIRTGYFGTSVVVGGVGLPTAVASGYKIARGSTAFDGSNPTTVATGLTSVVACTGTLLRTTAVSSGTAFITHAAASVGNVDWYEWVIAGSASSGTETFEWVCVGT